MTKINTLKDSLTGKIQALYDIEKEIEKALPNMERAATDPELKEGFTNHLEETKQQIRRLEDIFQLMKQSPKKLKVEGVRGIIQDGEWVSQVETSPAMKDALLAGAARYVEHYEMAGYLSAIEEAQILGLSEISDLLNATLLEEKATDEKLALAMRNCMALANVENEEDDTLE